MAGDKNTAFGAQALFHNYAGFSNTAGGYQSLYYNASGVYNTAYGESALYRNTAGVHNTAHGFSALLRNGVGTANTAIGSNTLTNNTYGGSNTACGYEAGNTNSTGSFNTFLGAYANALVNNLTNSAAIGYKTVIDASNKVRIGNVEVIVIEGAVPWSTPSDRRLKQNITLSTLGLSFISRLNPMSYTYIADKTNVRHDGLIAQDEEKVMQELGVDFQVYRRLLTGRILWPTPTS